MARNAGSAAAPELGHNPSLHSSSQKSLLPNGKPDSDPDTITTPNSQHQQQQQQPIASRLAFLHKFTVGYSSLEPRLLSPSKTFRQLAQAREMVSIQTREEPSSPPGIPLREGVNLPGVGEIRWKTMKIQALEWLRNPKNLALLVWITAVAISGAILFMVMTGMLNSQIPSKNARNAWFEVNNQILNALFTLMCLYLHPQRCLHLYQLYRWKRRDVISLRKIYCKDGLRKPHEWAHMLVVVVLLQLNCFSQYALCGLNWGYKRSERPAIGVAICLAGAIGFAAAAGVYNILSPLGRDYAEDEADRLRKIEEGQEVAAEEEEALEQQQLRTSTSSGKRKLYALLERRRSFAMKDGKPVERPEWRGGVLDCCMDQEVALLTTVCGFCVFGWNMDRLGFGNRFVHIATFMLICSAPYWIFLLAAGNIDNRYVKQGLGIAGALLCAFGLMYGGFWRIRMRRTYGLPAQTWCFGHANVTDCFLWMFCSLCALCQEVRTAGSYDIRDDKFFVKEPRNGGGGGGDGGASSSSSPPLSPSPLGREQPSKAVFESEMAAPSPVKVSRGADVFPGGSPGGEYHQSPARGFSPARDTEFYPHRSPAREQHQQSSPAREFYQQRSPARQSYQESSPAREQYHQSPAREHHQQSVLAREHHQQSSPGREYYQERSPARELHQHASPDGGYHQQKSPLGDQRSPSL